MQVRKPILAISDLTDRSDAAIQLAGKLAHQLTADLHVLHAMSLTYRPLRSVVPALSNMNGAIRMADGFIRAQVKRLVPGSVHAHAPVIDLDDSTRAVQRRAQEIDPWVVISPAIWQWTPNEVRHRTHFRAAFAHVRAPVLVIKEARRRAYGRVMVVSHSDTLHADSIESAGRWAFWLDHIYGSPIVEGGPHFDVMLLDDEAPSTEMATRLVDPRCDLIVIDPAMLLQDDVEEKLEFVMPILLKQTLTPIALLKASIPGGGGHASDDADRFAANQSARERAVESDGIAAGW